MPAERQHHFAIVKRSDLDTYTDDDKLGQGGFGTVFKVKHKQWGMKAIKVLKDAQQISEDEKKKLLNEAEKMAKLQHENILRILGVIMEPGMYAILFEYIANGSLDSFLKKRQVPLPIIVKFVYKTILGMNYLHTNVPTICHRDLRAANLLVTDAFDIKIADFGLSQWKTYTQRHSTRLSAELNKFGSFTHTSPERWRNLQGPPEKYHDVYAFGITLWEIGSNGKQPYQGRNAFEVTRMVTGGERPNMVSITNNFPEFLCDMMMASWSPNPETRPTFEALKNFIEKGMTEYMTEDAQHIATVQLLQEMGRHIQPQQSQSVAQQQNQQQVQQNYQEQAARAGNAPVPEFLDYMVASGDQQLPRGGLRTDGAAKGLHGGSTKRQPEEQDESLIGSNQRPPISGQQRGILEPGDVATRSLTPKEAIQWDGISPQPRQQVRNQPPQPYVPTNDLVVHDEVNNSKPLPQENENPREIFLQPRDVRGAAPESTPMSLNSPGGATNTGNHGIRARPENTIKNMEAAALRVTGGMHYDIGLATLPENMDVEDGVQNGGARPKSNLPRNVRRDAPDVEMREDNSNKYKSMQETQPEPELGPFGVKLEPRHTRGTPVDDLPDYVDEDMEDDSIHKEKEEAKKKSQRSGGERNPDIVHKHKSGAETRIYNAGGAGNIQIGNNNFMVVGNPDGVVDLNVGDIMRDVQSTVSGALNSSGIDIHSGNINIQGTNINLGGRKPPKVIKGTITKSQRKITNNDIDICARHTGKYWKKLGRELGYSDGQLDNFEHDNSQSMYEMIYQMLRDWRSKKSGQATAGLLAKTLNAVQKADVALKIPKDPNEK
ncbi:unnamed protein product [Owenia fusiformis]|uniref:Uncharacterized protein n=1 Tax=Owenia fusiformis TaxID=6347 RepID=A0A8J1TWT0_OWEFU|nr:unnamed protein product [Owenia fusiformis]